MSNGGEEELPKMEIRKTILMAVERFFWSFRREHGLVRF